MHHEELVGWVNAGYSSQEGMFGDAVKQGIKVKCQTGCAFHDHTNISLLMFIHVYIDPFPEIELGYSKAETVSNPKGSCAACVSSIRRLPGKF